MTRKDTAGRFLRSTGAAAFSQGWRVFVTFGTQLLLKRWIPAVDWGLWDWAMPIFLILGALRDLGLVYHVVRVKPRPYGNLLALEGIWGGLLVGAAFFAAPLAALAYHEPDPRVVTVLQAMTLFLFFEGISTVPRTYFESELEVGRAVAPEILRNLCFTGLSLLLAWWGFGVWSLVWGQVAGAGLYALLLWRRAWGEMPLHWERGETLRLIRASLPLATIWFLIILQRHVDPLILGWRYRGAVVGNYTFAYQNSFRVAEILVPAVARALYPALVAFAGEARRLFEAYRLSTLFVLALEVPAALFLFLNADLAIRILGGDQWELAPVFLRILCFAPLVDPFSRLGGELLKAQHHDGLWILSTLTTFLTFVIGGIWATGVMGPVGMAWVNLVPLGGLVMGWALSRVAPDAFRTLARDVVFLYLVPIPFFGGAWLLAPAGGWLLFGLGLLATAGTLTVYFWRYGAAFREFFRRPRELELPPRA